MCLPCLALNCAESISAHYQWARRPRPYESAIALIGAAISPNFVMVARTDRREMVCRRACRW